MNRRLNLDLCAPHAAQILDPQTNMDPHGVCFTRSRAPFERLEPTHQMFQTVHGSWVAAAPVPVMRLPDALRTAHRKDDMQRTAASWLNHRGERTLWSHVISINDSERLADRDDVFVSDSFGSIRAWVPFDSCIDAGLHVVSSRKRDGVRLRCTDYGGGGHTTRAYPSPSRCGPWSTVIQAMRVHLARWRPQYSTVVLVLWERGERAVAAVAAAAAATKELIRSGPFVHQN
jgi:hypothetical protein